LKELVFKRNTFLYFANLQFEDLSEKDISDSITLRFQAITLILFTALSSVCNVKFEPEVKYYSLQVKTESEESSDEDFLEELRYSMQVIYLEAFLDKISRKRARINIADFLNANFSFYKTV